MSNLANKYYKDNAIKQKVIGEDMKPKQLFPKENLISNMETEHLDAIAPYKNEALARGLEYIELPPEINLGNPSFSNFYKTATYDLTNGQTVYGEPIYFSVTMPGTCKNLAVAKVFVEFMLSPGGSSILQKEGLDHMKPPIQGLMASALSTSLSKF